MMNEEKKKLGRPKKKEYDESQLFRNLLNGVDYVYDCTREIKATAEELGISAIKVKKLLITSGKLEYDETRQIQCLLAYGKKMDEIQQEMGLKKSSINSYLPYSKIPYKSEEISSNADRCELYRKRKAAVEGIKDIDSLWNCILLFQNYSFRTSTGLKFSYKVKWNKKGKKNRELIIDQKEISITMSTVEGAYERTEAGKIYAEPEELGDLSGISYLYPIFYRFGLIDVPDKVREKMTL